MKSVIARIRSKWWERRAKKGGRRMPSLLKAMGALVPRKVIREVMISSHDRRQWGTLAAAWVGVSEREFFREAAQEMGIEFRERVVDPDLSVYGPQARSVLADLRRYGASVVLDGTRVIEVIAVDPSEARGLPIFDPASDVSLASWTEISRALEICERRIAELEANHGLLDIRRRDELCESLIDALVAEAKAHGSSSFELVTVDGVTRYQFYTSHGKLAVGTVHPDVMTDVRSFLKQREDKAVQTEASGAVYARSLGGGNFKLSWGAGTLPYEREVFLPSPNTAVVESPGAERELRQAASQGERQSFQGHEEPILVVDDNPMFCRVLDRLLRREGFAPYFAENGVAALTKLTASSDVLPKVVICDLHMPLMNGRELIARLKEDPRFKHIPIIVLTSDEDADVELQLLQHGADAYVSKVKDPRVLTSYVRKMARPLFAREAA